MFNSGNNKGPMSWLGNSPQVVHREHVVAVDNTVNGKNVDYWHAYAQGLKAQLAEVIEARDDAKRIAIERRANDAGLRAVIRYFITELRKASPNHELLDKKNRDRIFNHFHVEEMAVALKANDLQMWDPLKRPDEKQSP